MMRAIQAIAYANIAAGDKLTLVSSNVLGEGDGRLWVVPLTPRQGCPADVFAISQAASGEAVMIVLTESLMKSEQAAPHDLSESEAVEAHRFEQRLPDFRHYGCGGTMTLSTIYFIDETSSEILMVVTAIKCEMCKQSFDIGDHEFGPEYDDEDPHK